MHRKPNQDDVLGVHVINRLISIDKYREHIALERLRIAQLAERILIAFETDGDEKTDIANGEDIPMFPMKDTRLETESRFELHQRFESAARPTPYLRFQCPKDGCGTEDTDRARFDLVFEGLHGRCIASIPLGIEIFTQHFWHPILLGRTPIQAIDSEASSILAYPDRDYRHNDKYNPGMLLEVYDRSGMCEGIGDNLWTAIHSRELVTAITSDNFRVYWATLRSLVFDLIDFPLGVSKDWIDRERLINRVFELEGSNNQAALNNDRWQAARKHYKTTLPDKALYLRGLDARDYLNTTLPKIAGDTGHEVILRQIFRSFGGALVRQGNLIQCRHCDRYAAFWYGKVNCSPSLDRSNCGKASRDKRRDAKRRGVE